MSTYWRIDANGGWSFDDVAVVYDVASYITKVLPGCASYAVHHYDIAPNPPNQLQYGAYAYPYDVQVFGLYNHGSDISVVELHADIKQRAQSFRGYPLFAFREEYIFFRYVPLTQAEFNRQSDHYENEKYDEVLENDNVLSGEVQSDDDSGGTEV